MMYPALRVCIRSVAIWMIVAAPGAMCAQSVAIAQFDPDQGVQLAERLDGLSHGRQDAEFDNAMERAGEAYRDAHFATAIDWYQRAVEFVPSENEVQAMLDLTIVRRAAQREAVASLPFTPAQRESHYRGQFADARGLYKKKNYAKAYQKYYELWLVAGDFDGTLKQMAKTRKKGKLDSDRGFASELASWSGAPAPSAQEESLAAKAANTRGVDSALPKSAGELARQAESILSGSSGGQAEVLVAGADATSADLEAASLRIDELILQGQFEFQAGRNVIAKELYQRALALDPGNRVAERGLRLLNEKAQRQEEQVAGDRDVAKPLVSKSTIPDRVQAPSDAGDDAATAQAEEASAKAEAAVREAEQALAEQIREQARAEMEIQAAQKAEEARLAEIARAAEEARRAERERLDREKAENERRLDSLVSQAGSALARKDLDFAEQAYREALSIDGGNKSAVKGLEKIERARVRLAEQQREDEIESTLMRAAGQLEAHQFDDARSGYNAVLDLDPRNRAAKKGLKALERDLKDFERATLLASFESDIRTARNFSLSGQLEQARDTLQYVLNQDSDYKPARRELERVETQIQEAARRDQAQAEASRLAAAAESRRQAAAEVSAPLGSIARPETADAGMTPIASRPPSFEIAQAAGSEFGSEAPPEKLQAEPMTSESGEVAPRAQQPRRARDDRATLDSLQARALRLFRDGNIAEAREAWGRMLEIDPTDKRATTYLEETEAEYESYLADIATRENAAQHERLRTELLNSPVTIQTDRPTPLSEFMRLVSFSTATEIEYYIADGAEAQIFANFVDRTLEDVLDTILNPIGLSWEMDSSNLITIKTDLLSRTFQLATDQMNKVRSLLDSGTLQEIIWGQSEPPARGVEIILDERQRILLAVGSRLHIEKLEDFLVTLEIAETPDLETHVYKIREDDGPKIRALINALISEGSRTPFQTERKLFIDGTDLIIRDTPENIVKIEELLLDESFIEKLRNEQLEIVNFSLIPRDVENQGSDQIRNFTSKVVEMIETLLYARTGKDAALREGRRHWFDQANLQLTIVDTPTNLERVGNFVDSLPELRRRSNQKVIFLDHAIASEMASDLATFLDLSGAGAAGSGRRGEEIITRLRRGQEIEFRDIRIRLTRVEQNDPQDRNDDSVQLTIISGTRSNQITLTELETTFFEDYELTAEEVQPSGRNDDPNSTSRGEGNMRLHIRYIPPEEDGAEVDTGPVLPEDEEDQGIVINAFEPLNALVIRYDNPAILKEAMNLIEILDKPRKQVQVETRFVQVNETRAKEFSADFDLSGLTNDTNFNTDFWRFNSRFAQARDEFRDTFEPVIENPLRSNLLKGTTILDLVLGNGPSIGFQLRLLEAEGIINITNGPKVTMLDGVTGDFRIEHLGPSTSFGVNSGGGAGGGGGTRLFDPIGGGTGGGGGGGGQSFTTNNEDASSFNNRLTTVVLLVTPTITSEKSIILDITAELVDFEGNVGAFFFPTPGTTPTSIQPDSFIDPIFIPGGTGGTAGGTTGLTLTDPLPFLAANINPPGQMLRSRKQIITTARIEDGGTIVLGGWTGEFTQELTSGVPVLRNMPFVGKLLFSRNQRSTNRTTLLIFLTGDLIK